MDRLAQHGVRFDLAYANQAVCAPSRINLMSGARSTSSGIYNFGMNLRDYMPDAVTLPQYFMRAGYRSEEHTSELQSLMRISYAVFCLKKKKNEHKTIT